MSEEKDFLGTEPIGKLLAKLAVPTVAAQIINMLYNIVDRIYIGHIPKEGALALTGVGVCMPLIMIVTAFAAFVAYGGAPRATIFMGKGDDKTAEKILGNCFIVQIIISVLLTVALLLWNRDFLLAFGASEEMLHIGITGLRTNFCITPVLGFVMLATTFFQSIARPVPSIVITMLRQILFLIPFICIFPLIWGINGIFAAQPVSDAFALVLSVLLVLREQHRLSKKGKQQNLSPSFS